MKSVITSLLLTAAATTAAPSDYVNFIRQTQLDSGVEWDVHVPSMGSALSADGVGSMGSLFELWTSHNATLKSYLLDQKFVSAYTPDTTIEIVTGDPYKLIPRTRVDQPFAVEIKVSGFRAIPARATAHGEPAIPASAREVRLEHEVFNYPDGKHSLSGIAAPAPNRSNSTHLSGNGPVTLNFAMTSLTGPDLTKVEGEEVWTVSSLDEWGVNGKVLASKKLQVWPLADATISGVDPSVRYTNPPPITVNLNDLYPTSETLVRVYLGPPAAYTSGATKIRESYIVINDAIPQDRVLFLTSLDEYFGEEGAYTMEVLHTTPFGSELLTQFYPIRVDRTIEIRGGLYTTE